MPLALECTDIELSITLHMGPLKSPVVEREGASAHTLPVADYPYFRPCTSVRYQAAVQARRITILGTLY